MQVFRHIMSRLSHTARNKRIVSSFVDAINSKDWPRVLSLLAEDFKRHSVAAGEPRIQSAVELVSFLENEFETFPDAKEDLIDLVAEGQKVAALHRFCGTQLGRLGSYPPTGKFLDSRYIAIYKIEKNRITEAWVEWDNLSSLRRLGHLSSDS